MKSCLVVYFSRSGITGGVADRIAAECACDIERIHGTRPRAGLPGYLRSIYEAVTGKLPDILPLAGNPGDYELVILGTPVWAGHVSSPMRSFIQANASRFRQVAAFCTMGGSGGDKVLDEIAALCGKSLVARLVLTDKEIQGKGHQDKINLFTRRAATPG